MGNVEVPITGAVDPPASTPATGVFPTSLADIGSVCFVGGIIGIYTGSSIVVSGVMSCAAK
jgi:hypothetical protein